MSEIKYIPFEEESEEIKTRVTRYWTERAESFFDQRQHELHSRKAQKWKDEILGQIGGAFPEVLEDLKDGSDRQLKILDVGCGAGFFTVLLGKEGFDVMGVDLTEEMVREAERLIDMNGPYKRNVHVMPMDAESLSFDDETFDVVVTRNLTWTLPHPIEAYREWHRVLKKGGLFLNFDAEYAKGAHSLNAMDNLAHKNISEKLKDECHEIYHMLTISALKRPEWDKEVLRQIGFLDVTVDVNFCDRIFSEKDEFYIPDRMFMIAARK
ncbi:MAG: class I SAM-dependent methyltransferase [Butyrivibrio sp.]|nr:class I SAM-dependent methyltransferase [Butyrivibrio sp.]